MHVMNTPKNRKKVRIGTLLVSKGYLTESQLNQVVAYQKKAKSYLPLGLLCVERGLLSKAELLQILKTHKFRLYLGELLVNMSVVSPTQLDQALEEQKKTGEKLGHVLIQKGFISEGELVEALSIQLGIPRIIPDINLIDRGLALQVSEPFLRKAEAVPAFKDGERLTVIMADPLSETTIDDLKAVFRENIHPAIATRSGIHDLLDKLFQKIEFTGSEGAPSLEAKQLVIGDLDSPNDRNDREDVVNVINYIISSAVAQGSSDIHIEPFSGRLRVRYRIDGILLHKTDLPSELAPPILNRIKALCGLDIAERRRHQDGRLQAQVFAKDLDLRISVYASVHGESMVVRILYPGTELNNLDNLGFSPLTQARFKRMLQYPSGLILVTGPTGSGKTTTLYASLNHLNKNSCKIISVEDPVEYTIDGVIQGKLEKKLNLTYEDFLKAMMRQDPDVIMVGEIRDREAAEATIQAALTGHKVFTTFHTEDTTGALLRLMDMGIETFLISSTVVSVLSQRLARKLCPYCKEPHAPSKIALSGFNINEIDPSKYSFQRAVGCQQCNHTGYRGRTAIHELLVLNDAIRDAILSRKTSSEIRSIARRTTQMISMWEDGFYKAAKGITALEEVLRVVYHNEAEVDTETPRTADEIMAMLEGRDKSNELDLEYDEETMARSRQSEQAGLVSPYPPHKIQSLPRREAV
jgi:type IV pilus assembly protein PilB